MCRTWDLLSDIWWYEESRLFTRLVCIVSLMSFIDYYCFFGFLLSQVLIHLQATEMQWQSFLASSQMQSNRNSSFCSMFHMKLREVNQFPSPDCRGDSVLCRSWSLLVRLDSFSTPLRCLFLYSSLFLAFCVFLSLLLVFSVTSFFLSCASSLYPLFPFLSLSHSLDLHLSLWADSPSALILLCTVLLQMRQARRLSNPCIQRYTSRIGECSSTYVSSSKFPL